MIATESCFAQAALSNANTLDTLDTLARESCGTFAPQLQLTSTVPRVRGTLWPVAADGHPESHVASREPPPFRRYPTLTSKDATRWR
jgi:hypothetical protein